MPANLEDILIDYKHYLQLEKSLSHHSVDAYLRDVRKFIRFLESRGIRPVEPVHLNKDNLQAFIYEISDKLHPRSQARLISGLRNFFSYLLLEGILTTNPADWMESPKIRKKLPEVLSPDEVDKMLEVTDKSTYEGKRNFALLEIMYAAGLRVSEAVGLKKSDIFFEEGFLRIRGKGGKHRFVPLEEYSAAVLRDFILNDLKNIEPKRGYEDYVFLSRRGKPLTRQMAFLILKKVARKAGIRKIISPHTLRHSFATHLLNNGADLHSIQLLLGHENITTTEIYLHMSKKQIEDALFKYHPRANPKKN